MFAAPLLAILGVELPFTLTLASWLRYNAGMTALHFFGCATAHVVLGVLTGAGMLSTTGPVRSMSWSMSAYFLCADFVTWLFISLAFAHLTQPSAVDWSFDAPGVVQVVGTFLIQAVLQDAWHYPTHRYLHSTKIRWLRELHAHHHREVRQATEMNSLDVMNVNPLEYWITIMPAFIGGFCCSAALPAALGVRPNFFAAHLAVFTTYLVEGIGHSNVNIPLPLLRTFGFTMVPDHAMHHLKSDCNFAIFFTFADRTMGTYKSFAPRGGKCAQLA